MKQRLIELYRQFSLAEGSQHIASEFAILKIFQLINKFNLNHILEVGLGIGSLSGSILEVSPQIKYCGTETNKFCLSALSLNLGSNFKRVLIFPDLSAITGDKKFDLIIVDGKDPNISEIKRIISNSGIIAIEGGRLEQQNELLKIFPDCKFVHLISSRKNKKYSPFPDSSWQGGLKVIFVSPTIRQKVWWAKNKMKSKLISWYRIIHEKVS